MVVYFANFGIGRLLCLHHLPFISGVVRDAKLISVIECSFPFIPNLKIPAQGSVKEGTCISCFDNKFRTLAILTL